MDADPDVDEMPHKGGGAGGAIPGLARPAFRQVSSGGARIPVLISAPHGGRAYPKQVSEAMRGGGATRLRLEDRYIDVLARQIAQETGADLLYAEAPRAILDLNRASDDVDWSMVAGVEKGQAKRQSAANQRARSGLGLVPRRLPGLGEIWKTPLGQAELEARIDAIHRPYHEALGRSLERIRDVWGAALLVDLHSMPPLRRRFPGEDPAEFVIGDRFGESCDPVLAAFALSYFSKHGRRVAHNRPYSGGYILDRHAKPRRGVYAIQIEVCRSLYLDANFDQPTARMPSIARLLAGLVRGFARQTVDLAALKDMPNAAE